MARRRTPAATASGSTQREAPGGRFTRAASTWRDLGAPLFMVDDADAIACYDLWLHNKGPAKLRAALGWVMVPAPDVDHLKVTYLRRLAAPRLLWRADALDAAEVAALLSNTLELSEHPPVNEHAPNWLSGTPPWRTPAE